MNKDPSNRFLMGYYYHYTSVCTAGVCIDVCLVRIFGVCGGDRIWLEIDSLIASATPLSFPIKIVYTCRERSGHHRNSLRRLWKMHFCNFFIDWKLNKFQKPLSRAYFHVQILIFHFETSRDNFGFEWRHALHTVTLSTIFCIILSWKLLKWGSWRLMYHPGPLLLSHALHIITHLHVLQSPRLLIRIFEM